MAGDPPKAMFDVIATLVKPDGKCRRFALPEEITIPPCYVIHGGRLWACQPDWEVPKYGAIAATYRQLSPTRAVDLSLATPLPEEKPAKKDEAA